MVESELFFDICKHTTVVAADKHSRHTSGKLLICVEIKISISKLCHGN